MQEYIKNNLKEGDSIFVRSIEWQEMDAKFITADEIGMVACCDKDDKVHMLPWENIIFVKVK